MPFYEIKETTIGQAQRTRIGYIYAETKEEVHKLANSGSIKFEDDIIHIDAELTLYDIEEIKVN